MRSPRGGLGGEGSFAVCTFFGAILFERFLGLFASPESIVRALGVDSIVALFVYAPTLFAVDDFWAPECE